MAELYFGERENGVQADIVRYVQYPAPIEGIRSAAFYTTMIDLTRSEPELLSEMKHNTRYEIRRGTEKDRFTAHVYPSPARECVREFCEFYDRFALTKALPKANRAKLDALLDASLLAVSAAEQDGGSPLVWHAYIRTGSRARLLHSASLFRREADRVSRQIAGRANRFLLWADMRHFKGAGIRVFDLGGWYEGSTDCELLRVNAFKEGFGGERITTFNAEIAATWKGELALRALRMLRRVRP